MLMLLRMLLLWCLMRKTVVWIWALQQLFLRQQWQLRLRCKQAASQRVVQKQLCGSNLPHTSAAAAAMYPISSSSSRVVLRGCHCHILQPLPARIGPSQFWRKQTPRTTPSLTPW